MARTRLSQPDESLPAMLARVARHRTDGELVTLVLAGLAGVAGGMFLDSRAALLSAVGVAAAAFGGWGICDRELAERGSVQRMPMRTALAATRAIIAAAGVAAVGFTVFRVLHLMLGTWIS